MITMAKVQMVYRRIVFRIFFLFVNKRVVCALWHEPRIWKKYVHASDFSDSDKKREICSILFAN